MRQLPLSMIRTSALLLAAIALIGCSSGPKGPERSAKAVESFKDTRKHLTNASKQVGATNDSLRKLTTASGDLRSMYNKFVDNVKETQDMAEGARKRAENMRVNSERYTAQWQKEMSSIT